MGTNYLPPPTHHRANVPVKAAAALSAFTFVDFAGNPAAAGEGGWGAVDCDVASGDLATVYTEGVVAIKSGAAGLAANAVLESDGTGQAVAHTTGVVRGRIHPSFQGPSVVGQILPVVLFPQLS